jgi:tetratricopeptide (TPR) repeat protein
VISRRWAAVSKLVAGSLVAAISSSGAAVAQDPPQVVEAREHLARGDALVERNDLDAALTEFELAYRVVGQHPVRHLILFNIGKAHELMFRYDLALEYYHRYLEEGGPNADDRAVVEATIATLEGLLATLTIATNVAVAEVWIDDRRVGSAPGRVRIPGGRHLVELRASGYEPARQEVQVAARAERTLAFTLDALADEYRGLSPVVFWSVAGAGLASLGAGGVVGLLALSAWDDEAALRDDPITSLDANALSGARARVEQLSLVADLFYLGGAVLGVGALVLAFLTEWGAEPETVAIEVSPAIDARSLALSLRGVL